MNPTALLLAGGAMLAAAKVAHKVRGYKQPRPFTDPTRAITYDRRVVDEWESNLLRWGGAAFAESRVLELGPGPDLGVAALLLQEHGAASYAALDANELIGSDSPEFYNKLLPPDGWYAFRSARRRGLIEYQVDPTFSIARTFPNRKFDLFLSQAAFEHFDDPIATLHEVTGAAAPGAALCFAVDLAAHSRWIRDVDPLNIYRFSDKSYKWLSFRGQPNRVPLSRYLQALEDDGWVDIHAFTEYDVKDFDRIRPTLNERFRTDETRHRYFVLCARWPA